MFIFIARWGNPQTPKKRIMNTKQFAVLHVQKGSSSGGRGLGAHIDRDFIPKNADQEKQHLNEHLIDSNVSMNKDIDRRLKEVGCKVRSNSVKSVNIILTGSHDRMKEIEKDPKLYRSWVNDNRQFVENEYGKENVVRFTVHRDERTPHIHCVIVPITQDGRLSAKEIVGNRNKLKKLQNDYAERMKKYKLHRGIEGSKAKHYEVSEYYARLKDPVSTKISIPKKKLIESNEKYSERVKDALKPLIMSFNKVVKQNKGFNQHLEQMSGLKEWLEQQERELRQEKEKTQQERKLAESAKNEYNNRSEKDDQKAINIGRVHGHKELLNLINKKVKASNADFQFELTDDGAVKVVEIQKKKQEIEPRRNQNRLSR